MKSPRTFLNLSLSLESDSPIPEVFANLDLLQEFVRERVEDALAEFSCVTYSCTWDRDRALAWSRETSAQAEVQVLTNHQKPAILPFVMEEFGLTLPNKPGDPEWRPLKSRPYGEVNGLPGLRGNLVCTNGIVAILIRPGTRQWVTVHLHWFKVDKGLAKAEGSVKPYAQPDLDEPEDLKEARLLRPRKEPSPRKDLKAKILEMYA